MFKVHRWTKATSRKPRCLSVGSYSFYLQLYNLQSELKVTHENVPTALPHFKNVIFRHYYIMQKNSSYIETEISYLCKVLHFNRQNLLIGTPNDWVTAYGSYWKCRPPAIAAPAKSLSPVSRCQENVIRSWGVTEKPTIREKGLR